MGPATDLDLPFMKQALKLAKKALGRTSPNPLVGAVVVKNGKVVGLGYHKKAGTPHAEVHALRAAGEKAKGATIYVTLEPCNHTGKTPPCTHAILKSGIARVVVGMVDPNPLVAGSGCRFLESQGVEVVGELLAEECRAINRPFIKYITTGLPWVIMKAGCSLDGRIAVADGRCAWITGDESRCEVHRVRDRVDTAINDDPSLTSRLPGRKGHDPLRVVLDTSLRMSPQAVMLSQESSAATWIFCSPKADLKKRQALQDAGARVIDVPEKNGRPNLPDVLRALAQEGHTSLLVEGGSAIHTSFLKAGLVDQVTLFMAPLFLGNESIPVVGDLAITDVGAGRRFQTSRVKRFGNDVLIEGFFSN